MPNTWLVSKAMGSVGRLSDGGVSVAVTGNGMKPLSALSIAGSDVAVAIEAVGDGRTVLTVSGTACSVADAVGLGVLVAGTAVGATVTSDAACTVAIVLRRVSVAGLSAAALAPNVSRFSVQVSRN